MVCYHTPKSISLDIFELLITATQTNTNKQIRHPTPHSNKQIKHPTPHSNKHKQTNQTLGHTPNPLLPLNHSALSVSSSKIQRYVSLSLSLSFIFFLFKPFLFYSF